MSVILGNFFFFFNCVKIQTYFVNGRKFGGKIEENISGRWKNFSENFGLILKNSRKNFQKIRGKFYHNIESIPRIFRRIYKYTLKNFFKNSRNFPGKIALKFQAYYMNRKF